MTRSEPAQSGLPVVIAGAGIGGLAFAIACRQRGVPVRLLEARTEPATDGAGIQLGPNATRVLEALGVAETVRADVCAPAAIVVRQGRSGRILQRLPLGQDIAIRHGAPYWVMHRTDLHRALTRGLADTHGTVPDYGWRVADVGERVDRVEVVSEAGETVRGAVLVAADGLWSRLRARVVGADHPMPFSGKSAARTIVPRAGLPSQMASLEVGVWFSPHGHLVHYPVEAGRSVAVVAVTSRGGGVRGWGEAQPAAAMADDLARIAPALDPAWANAADWRMWALFDPEPFARVHARRICLIGDAAHPVLPFLAQGGGLALEDAIVLADAIASSSNNGSDLAAAFAVYAQKRSARTAKVQATARRNGRIYQLGGPFALARDLTLRALPGHQVMAGYDWLYGWHCKR